MGRGKEGGKKGVLGNSTVYFRQFIQPASIRIQNISTFNHGACYVELLRSPVKTRHRFSLITQDERERERETPQSTPNQNARFKRWHSLNTGRKTHAAGLKPPTLSLSLSLLSVNGAQNTVDFLIDCNHIIHRGDRECKCCSVYCTSGGFLLDNRLLRDLSV